MGQGSSAAVADSLAGGTLVVGIPAADTPAGGTPEAVDTLAADILGCTVDHHNTLGSRNSLGSGCGDDGRSLWTTCHQTLRRRTGLCS